MPELLFVGLIWVIRPTLLSYGNTPLLCMERSSYVKLSQLICKTTANTVISKVILDFRTKY